MEWAFWISIAVNLAFPPMLFFARNWLKARIEKSVQHGFDEKIEKLRSELRKNEERFKKELQDTEAEIAMLRSAAIGRQAARQSILDKRRIEAVERVWAAFVALAPFYPVAAMMSRFNIDSASKQAYEAENVRKIFDTVSGMVKIEQINNTSARTEQPFISDLAWAYFSVYQTTVILSYMTAKALATGIGDVDKLIKFDRANQMLKTALPHHEKLIDEHGFACHFFLLEELESNLLSALKTSLVGAALDRESVDRAAKIIRMSKEARVTSDTGAPQDISS